MTLISADVGDAAAWPVQGLLRRFKHVLKERVEQGPEAWEQNQMKYYQKAWSGAPFANEAWTQNHGDKRTFSLKL